MLNLTPIIRPWFARRCRESAERYLATEATQRNVLQRLIHEACDTAYGHEYGFSSIRSYTEYRERVPAAGYPEFRPYVERMLKGEADVLWPGHCTRFAQSSGTSDGKSKYIPITLDGMRRNHYMGASDVVAHYLNLYDNSRIFGGKSFILGGSFANELRKLRKGVKVGDLSANLIDGVSPAINFFRVPPKHIALMPDWNEKLPALVKASINQDITNISGVPSWFLTVLRSVIERAGASTIHDVWPNLEVFFHGGISFTPYREQYAAITDPAKMRYLETYNASEGFFAVQDTLDSTAMLLLLDIGVFYEFIPLADIDNPHPNALAAWEVEPGRTYAMLISTCNGLWRYALGDTVRIESVEPLRISIAGRTRSFINTFGEELMVYNADTALAEACKRMGVSVLNYTAAPVYADCGKRGRHQWLIEWNKAPTDIEAFADELDRQLCRSNSDYQAKRDGGIFLDRLSITSAVPGLFNKWLSTTGKLGGQRKVPRLSNTRTTIDSMLNLNS